MIYYAVFNNTKKEPDGIFKTRRWAENFRDNQKQIWKEVKYSIWEVDIPRTSRKKLKIVKKITWADYVKEGLKILSTNIKNNAKERYTRFFRQSK